MNVKWNYVNVVGKPIKVCVQCSLCSFEPATRGESNPQKKKRDCEREKWREDERRATTLSSWERGKISQLFFPSFLLQLFAYPESSLLAHSSGVRARTRTVDCRGSCEKKGRKRCWLWGWKEEKKKLMAARVERGFECLSFNAKQNVFLGKKYYSKRNFSVVFPTNLTPSLSLNNTVVSNWVLLDFRLLTARLG